MNSPADAASLSPPWGPVPLPEDTPVSRRIGPREVWFLFRQGEIRVSDGIAAPGLHGDTPPPTDASVWSRWALPEAAATADTARVILRPDVPERTLIVQPELPFSLLPRAEARVFVRIPLRIRVHMVLDPARGGEAGTVVLRTLPTLELSDTWWGGFLEGEICSWLPTSARRVVGPEHLEPHLAICPLRLVNQSNSDLRVEKLAFRVEHLSLYADRRGFWADESRVRYQGESEGSQIDMSGAPPPEAESPTLIHAPALPARGIRALTFNRLRNLASFGGGA
jgi:hypothetical protein